MQKQIVDPPILKRPKGERYSNTSSKSGQGIEREIWNLNLDVQIGRFDTLANSRDTQKNETFREENVSGL